MRCPLPREGAAVVCHMVSADDCGETRRELGRSPAIQKNVCSWPRGGSPRTRFCRAIERRSLIHAELAAREMGLVTLEEALQLVVLYAEQADPRAERAMVKWLGRLFSEKRIEFALAARCVELIAELRGPEAERAARALSALVAA